MSLEDRLLPLTLESGAATARLTDLEGYVV